MSDNCRDLFFTETTATALGSYSAYIGDGVNKTYNITHNLNSEKVTYSLRDVQTEVLGYAQVNVTGPDTVTISFDDPPALTAFYFTIFASITAKQVTGFEDRITVNVTQPVQDISVNVADTNDVILVSPQQDVITISTSVQSVPGVTIDVGVVDTQEQVNVAVDTAATAWGTIIGTLSAQTDLWGYISGDPLSPSFDSLKILNSNEYNLNISAHNAFFKAVSSSNIFTYSNFTSGRAITLYLSAGHSGYYRHYFPANTYLQSAGSNNSVFTFEGNITKITLQSIDSQYIGTANTIQTNIPPIVSRGFIMIDNIFGFLQKEDKTYLLLNLP
jgi:hypothetical protein